MEQDRCYTGTCNPANWMLPSLLQFTFNVLEVYLLREAAYNWIPTKVTCLGVLTCRSCVTEELTSSWRCDHVTVCRWTHLEKTEDAWKVSNRRNQRPTLLLYLLCTWEVQEAEKKHLCLKGDLMDLYDLRGSCDQWGADASVTVTLHFAQLC